MASRKFSIVIACLFVLGAFTWYGARFWTFGHVPASFAIPCVLAIALAVSQAHTSAQFHFAANFRINEPIGVPKFAANSATTNLTERGKLGLPRRFASK